jgi:outer membrane protein OmpU
MKNIMKKVFVLLTSISLFGSANAGELAVSGTAKATYNILTGTALGKGIGITNELNFTASGELDNGYTWSYSMELDPADASTGGAATNDDTQLTMTTPYGTVGVFVLEGGLDAEDAASQSVYSRPTDMGDPSATVDNYSIDSYNNLQYHTPADLLPFGLTAKIAYAPDPDSTNNSGNGAGANQVQKQATYVGAMTAVRVDASPIDGLKIGASYNEFDKQGIDKNNQEAESGAYYATYSYGNISAGYSKAYRADLVTDGALNTNLEVESYDQTNMSIAYVINDDLSVSYEKETSEVSYQEGDEADVEQKSTGYQVAYNMGGMTLALARNSHDNVGYSTTAPDRDQTLFAVTMAF